MARNGRRTTASRVGNFEFIMRNWYPALVFGTWLRLLMSRLEIAIDYSSQESVLSIRFLIMILSLYRLAMVSTKV
jgi:hypothetical protein